MNKKILVISWFYPPINSSEGLVTYKLLKSSKYKYDVYTQKNNTSWSYGNKDILPESENVTSIFANANNIDEWMNEAIKYYKENVDKYDIVMTRSMPPESHKIGLEIKKINPNIIWIASFGDPLAENPYTKIAVPYESPYRMAVCKNFLGIISPKRIIKNMIFKTKYKKQYKTIFKDNEILQKAIIEKSNYIIFNNEYQKEYMTKDYIDIDNKTVVLNHSFDSSLYPENKEKENSKIQITYVGHLDLIRKPTLFLEALNELANDDKNLKEKLHVDFYGNMSDWDKLYIINNELTDIVKVNKPISYLESLKVMKNSDWLLQIDANINSVIDKNIFFAAKLADYIGSGTNIFGITMLEGISADILRNLNQLITSYSKEEIKNYLWLIIYKNYKLELNESYRKKFDSIEVAKKFDILIEKIRGEKNDRN